MKSGGKISLHLLQCFFSPLFEINFKTEEQKNGGFLHCLATKPFNPLAELFIRNGYNLCLQDSDGNTALHLSIAASNDQMTHYLLDRMSELKFSFSVKNNEEKTTLDLVEISGRTDLVEKIRKLLLEFLNPPSSNSSHSSYLSNLSSVELLKLYTSTISSHEITSSNHHHNPNSNLSSSDNLKTSFHNNSFASVSLNSSSLNSVSSFTSEPIKIRRPSTLPPSERNKPLKGSVPSLSPRSVSPPEKITILTGNTPPKFSRPLTPPPEIKKVASSSSPELLSNNKLKFSSPSTEILNHNNNMILPLDSNKNLSDSPFQLNRSSFSPRKSKVSTPKVPPKPKLNSSTLRHLKRSNIENSLRNNMPLSKDDSHLDDSFGDFVGFTPLDTSIDDLSFDVIASRKKFSNPSIDDEKKEVETKEEIENKFEFKETKNENSPQQIEDNNPQQTKEQLEENKTGNIDHENIEDTHENIPQQVEDNNPQQTKEQVEENKTENVEDTHENIPEQMEDNNLEKDENKTEEVNN